MPSEVERVVIISDIHMGADDRRGIFTAQKELAQFIDHLTSSRERMELVILGDALDYLQILPYLDFTNATAVTKTNTIVENNRNVFAALRGFVESGKRIRWCIGNHDIELLFSDVRKIIEAAVLPTGSNDGRLSWELEGERIHYPLSDGRRVRLVHGNKYDSWNDVDYKKAKEIVDRGVSVQFAYPPGSNLVANVMNSLKSDGFLHIDLLKPEITVAVPLALALWPENTSRHLRNAFPNWFDATRGSARKWVSKWFKRERPTFGARDTTEWPLNTTPDELFIQSLRRGFADGGDIEQVGKDLTNLLGDPSRARDVANAWSVSSRGTFSDNGATRFISKLVQSGSRVANDWSNPWSTEKPDELEEYVCNALRDDKDVAVVIAGHTHLARAVSYENGYYINTGTWANLMHIPTYFKGKKFEEHAKELRGYFSSPETAPAELRPFQRLTYAEVDLRPKDGKPFRAELREWIAEPSRKITRFP